MASVSGSCITEREVGGAVRRARRLVRAARAGCPCRCFACGREVYPLPLAVPSDPALPIRRGYAAVGAVVDARTHRLRLQPRLLCPACVDPAEVDAYRARFERMVADPCHDRQGAPDGQGARH